METRDRTESNSQALTSQTTLATCVPTEEGAVGLHPLPIHSSSSLQLTALEPLNAQL